MLWRFGDVPVMDAHEHAHEHANELRQRARPCTRVMDTIWTYCGHAHAPTGTPNGHAHDRTRLRTGAHGPIDPRTSMMLGDVPTGMTVDTHGRP